MIIQSKCFSQWSWEDFPDTFWSRKIKVSVCLIGWGCIRSETRSTGLLQLHLGAGEATRPWAKRTEGKPSPRQNTWKATPWDLFPLDKLVSIFAQNKILLRHSLGFEAMPFTMGRRLPYTKKMGTLRSTCRLTSPASSRWRSSSVVRLSL